MLPASLGPPQTRIPSEPQPILLHQHLCGRKTRYFFAHQNLSGFLWVYFIFLRSGITEEQKLSCSLIRFVCAIHFLLFVKFGDRSREILEDTFVAPSSSVDWRTVTKSGKDKNSSIFVFLSANNICWHSLFCFDRFLMDWTISDHIKSEQKTSLYGPSTPRDTQS